MAWAFLWTALSGLVASAILVWATSVVILDSSLGMHLFDAAAALSHEQTTRAVGGSFPSIRETLSHMAAADWIWLCRWTGESPKGWPTWANGSVSEIHEEWRRIHAARKEFILGLADADLDREISFTRINGDGSVEARVIDLEKSRWHPSKTACALRDLYSLTLDSLCWSRTDRMRFLKSYLGIARLTPYAKSLWRRIAAHALGQPVFLL